MSNLPPMRYDNAAAPLSLKDKDEGALLAVIRQLSRARSLEQIMSIVSHGVRGLLHADGATFVLREGDRCHYAEEDAVSPLWKGRRFPMSACISGWCMTHREPVAIPDIYRDERIPTDAYRPTFVRSLALAPVNREHPIAALGAYWSQARQPQQEEIELLQAMADAAALAVANVQLRQESAPASGPEPDRPKSAAIHQRTFGTLRLTSITSRLLRDGVRPNTPEAYLFAGLCVVGATLARLGILATGAQELAAFSTYYPTVLLAMLVGGRGAGIVAAAFGGLAALFMFAPPLTLSDALDLALYAGACALIILIIDWYKRSVLRLKQEDANHLTIAREEHHRMLNATHVVEIIVRQSLKDDPLQARIINQRIRAALAGVGIHGRAAAEPISLRALLTDELDPFGHGRIRLHGPELPLLPANLRTLVSLVGHELATNALKYGALSNGCGHVTIRWRMDKDAIKLSWHETGGPPVKAPSRQGYGSVMLRRLIEGAGGTFDREFRATGLVAEISLPRGPAQAHGFLHVNGRRTTCTA
jgi:two-component sensor histidine kinase